MAVIEFPEVEVKKVSVWVPCDDCKEASHNVAGCRRGRAVGECSGPLRTIVTPRGRNYSSVRAFRRCSQKYQYRYIDGLEPKVQPFAAMRGSIIHDCVEAYYTVGISGIKKVLTRYTEEWDALTEKQKARYKPYEKSHRTLPDDVRDIMRSYLPWAKEHDDDWVPEALEATFTYRYQGFLFKGTVDGLWRRKSDDTLWLVEHKSGLAGNTSYTHKRVDPQTAFYYWVVERIIDEELSGVVFNSFPAGPAARPSLTPTGKLSHKRMKTDAVTFDREIPLLGFDLDDEDVQAYREKVVANESHLFDRVKVDKNDTLMQTIVSDFQ